jgi:thiol:disulfide interchange protein
VFLKYFLFAVLVSVLLTAIFLLGLGRKETWRDFLVFFVLVFLATWAGGLWVTPVGPSVWGVYWVPFLFAGLMFALLLAATAPPRRPRSLPEQDEQAREEKKIEREVGWLFWVLIATLVATIVVRSLWPQIS